MKKIDLSFVLAFTVVAGTYSAAQVQNTTFANGIDNNAAALAQLESASSKCAPAFPARLSGDGARSGIMQGVHGKPINGDDLQLTDRDYARMVEEFKAEAIKGSSSAELVLGFLYEQGIGVSKDYSLARLYFKAAAQQGNTLAANNLGTMYEWGCGNRVNRKEAAQWYEVAADGGDLAAEQNLAGLYFSGKGVHRNYTQAAGWVRKAAEKNAPSAQAILAYMYAVGKGVPRDYMEATLWARRSAEQGDPQGEAVLASLYEQGKGVPLDYVHAYHFYLLSLRGGHKSSQDRMDALSQVMTKRQINEASSLDAATMK